VNAYDYKQNIQNLIKRYENKLIWLKNNETTTNYILYAGLKDGLLTAINDLKDLFDEVDM
jgi:hypothetical protein